MFFANVVPRSLRAIPWGWTNETHSIDAPGLPSKMTFVAKPLGWIEMPVDLASFFDWTTFLVEQVEQEKLWGTQNFKSIFTTAARFLGYERLLAERPSLSSITDGFLEWNRALLAHVGSHLRYFMIGDDIAGNSGLFLSREDFCLWLAPEYERLVALARLYGLECAFHSDGDIYSILPILRDLGFTTVSYQPIGQMLLPSARAFGLRLVPVEDQARENEETLRLQRGGAS